jgi:hypothetical protein
MGHSYRGWVGRSGPGYSDLNVCRLDQDSKLKGPFMALIKGEVGVSWLIDNLELCTPALRRSTCQTPV